MTGMTGMGGMIVITGMTRYDWHDSDVRDD